MISKGFTLIELMIVVAIIGILSMFALPAYQDYTKRTHMGEGLTIASGAKMQATEYYAAEGLWPADNATAGLAPAVDITGRAVTSVEVTDTAAFDGTLDDTDDGEVIGSITITYNDKVDSTAKTVVLGASYNNALTGASAVRWYCNGGTLDNKYRPANCRK